MDSLWLFYRVIYAICHTGNEESKHPVKLGFLLRNTVPEIKELLVGGGNKSRRGWHEMQDAKFEVTEQQWANAGGKPAEPVDEIRQLHFEVLRRAADDCRGDPELEKKYAELRSDLLHHKEYRRNLEQFLKPEHAKELLAKIKIENDVSIEAKLIEGESVGNKKKRRAKKKKNEEIGEGARKQDKGQIVQEKRIEVQNNGEIVMENGKAKSNGEILAENGKVEKQSNGEKAVKNEKIMKQSNGEIVGMVQKQSNEEIVGNKEMEMKKKSEMQKVQSSQKMNNNDQVVVRKLDNDKLARELAKIRSFDDFRDDSMLYIKYKEYILWPLEEKLVILVIGAYINEIWHRFEMFDELKKFGLSDQKLQLSREQCSSELSEYQNEHNLWNAYDIIGIEQKFGKILAKNGENGHLNVVKMQIHARKLAMTMGKDGQLAREWAKLENGEKRAKLANLLGTQFGPTRFEGIMRDMEMMMDQVELDQELFDKLVPMVERHKYLLPTFPKISQQLDAYKDGASEKLENFLTHSANGTMPNQEFDQRLKKSLQKIHGIVADWSGDRARLLISGSFLLGSHTSASDIDLICLVPGRLIRSSNFFGEQKTICKDKKCGNEREPQEKSSLYCILCKDKNVDHLVKITFGAILLLKFKIDAIDIDLAFVAIPGRKALPDLIDDQIIGEFLKKFRGWDVEHRMMIRALSGYRSYLRICKLLKLDMDNGNWNTILDKKSEIKNPKNLAQNSTKFRTLLLTLKSWAKNNYIYSNKFGFFNGVILTIMATKLMLLYPRATITFLLDKFFLIYSTRPSHVPVQLERIVKGPKPNPFFLQNPLEQQMPVFTPGFLEQNAARLVTHSSARTMRGEMRKALNKIRSAGVDNMDWISLIDNSEPFVDKFDQFILITCWAENAKSAGEFCRFVDGRIRLQLANDIDITGPETQLYPDFYREACRFPEKMALDKERAKHCKLWLVGIVINGDGQLDWPSVLAKFDETIKRHFLKYNPPPVEQDEGSNPEKFEQYRNPELYDVEAMFRELIFDLKSVMVTRREIDGL